MRLMFVLCFVSLLLTAQAQQKDSIPTPQARFFVGTSISHFTFSLPRTTPRNFMINLETQAVFHKQFTAGAEFGYANRWRRIANTLINSEGWYIKPFVTYSPLRNWQKRRVSPQIQMAVPLIFFGEKYELTLYNQFYPTATKHFERTKQFARGIEFTALVNFKIYKKIYLSTGLKHAPWLYAPVVHDEVPLNVRYFAGSGVNSKFWQTIEEKTSHYTTWAFFVKLMVGF